MRHVHFLVVAGTLAIAASAASAAPGDVVVPAHRTKDGHWVPANVPPTSGRTYLARRPTRAAASSKHKATSTPSAIPASEAASARSEPLLPPLLVEAQPIRR